MFITKGFIGQIFDFIFSEVDSITDFHFYLKNPSGVETQKEGSKTAGDSPSLRYVSVEDDFIDPGAYSLQLWIKSATFEGRRETIFFTVYNDHKPLKQ